MKIELGHNAASLFVRVHKKRIQKWMRFRKVYFLGVPAFVSYPAAKIAVRNATQTRMINVKFMKDPPLCNQTSIVN